MDQKFLLGSSVPTWALIPQLSHRALGCFGRLFVDIGEVVESVFCRDYFVQHAIDREIVRRLSKTIGSTFFDIEK